MRGHATTTVKDRRCSGVRWACPLCDLDGIALRSAALEHLASAHGSIAACDDGALTDCEDGAVLEGDCSDGLRRAVCADHRLSIVAP